MIMSFAADNADAVCSMAVVVVVVVQFVALTFLDFNIYLCAYCHACVRVLIWFLSYIGLIIFPLLVAHLFRLQEQFHPCVALFPLCMDGSSSR
jgi:hypothetical protein